MKKEFNTGLIFQSVTGKKVNLVNFCLQQFEAHPNCKLYVGTDSQRKKNKKKRGGSGGIVFITVVAVRYGKNGASFVYNKQHLDRMTPEEKLRTEMNMTMAYVDELEKNEILVDFIEFDYNEEAKWLSNKMVNEATGWAKGVGYKTLIKPDELIAVKAANHLCGSKK